MTGVYDGNTQARRKEADNQRGSRVEHNRRSGMDSQGGGMCSERFLTSLRCFTVGGAQRGGTHERGGANTLLARRRAEEEEEALAPLTGQAEDEESQADGQPRQRVLFFWGFFFAITTLQVSQNIQVGGGNKKATNKTVLG